MNKNSDRIIRFLPYVLAAAAIGIIYILITSDRPPDFEMRLPGADNKPAVDQALQIIKIQGQLIQGNAVPSDIPGQWPGFRGPLRNNYTTDPEITLASKWPEQGPPILWSLDVGEGYAGAAVFNGRVYLIDYDRADQQDVIRCLSLDNGQDIWRYQYPVKIKRNHGMSRTIPAVSEKYVVAMGPKCHVTCLNSQSGEFIWMINLVAEYEATIPAWYAGQCPLIDEGRVILAPAGSCLMMAVDCATGQEIWKTPNTDGWTMTHSSIMKAELYGRKMYLYCGSGGVVAVDAHHGELLWKTTEWKIRIANVPSPVVIDGNRIFFSGGYNSGCKMMKINLENGHYQPEILFSLKPEIFGSAQQTPIYYHGYIYGIRPDEQMVCLDMNGTVRWTSTSSNKFGLGPYLIVNDILFAMNDSGVLSMMEATPNQFVLLDRAKLLKGHDSWAPMAYVHGRLILRDMTNMICVKIGE